MDLAATQKRIAALVDKSSREGRYWLLTLPDGRRVSAFFCSLADIDRVRLHYPGATGVAVQRDEWMRSDDPETLAEREAIQLEAAGHARTEATP